MMSQLAPEITKQIGGMASKGMDMAADQPGEMNG
jgi:hypothetical protein